MSTVNMVEAMGARVDAVATATAKNAADEAAMILAQREGAPVPEAQDAPSEQDAPPLGAKIYWVPDVPGVDRNGQRDFIAWNVESGAETDGFEMHVEFTKALTEDALARVEKIRSDPHLSPAGKVVKLREVVADRLQALANAKTGVENFDKKEVGPTVQAPVKTHEEYSERHPWTWAEDHRLAEQFAALSRDDKPRRIMDLKRGELPRLREALLRTPVELSGAKPDLIERLREVGAESFDGGVELARRRSIDRARTQTHAYVAKSASRVAATVGMSLREAEKLVGRKF